MGFHIEETYIPYKPRVFNRHLRFFYGKHCNDIRSVSRKTKKAMLGRKWGKANLKRRINAVVVTPMPYPEPAELSDRFCPKCGCERTRYTGNMSSWPELWTRTYCLRCGFLVATADNSPEVHVLELMRGPNKDEWDPKYWG